MQTRNSASTIGLVLLYFVISGCSNASLVLDPDESFQVPSYDAAVAVKIDSIDTSGYSWWSGLNGCSKRGLERGRKWTEESIVESFRGYGIFEEVWSEEEEHTSPYLLKVAGDYAQCRMGAPIRYDIQLTWVLRDKRTGFALWSDVIDSQSKVTVGQAFIGARRSNMAQKLVIRNNVETALQRLSDADLNIRFRAAEIRARLEKRDATLIEASRQLLADAGGETQLVERVLFSVATERGDRDLIKMLIERGVAVNEKDESTGLYPIQVAAARGHVEESQLLLDAGADPNVEDESGVSAVYYAALNQHPEAWKHLLDHGATVSTSASNERAYIVAKLNHQFALYEKDNNRTQSAVDALEAASASYHQASGYFTEQRREVRKSLSRLWFKSVARGLAADLTRIQWDMMDGEITTDVNEDLIIGRMMARASDIAFSGSTDESLVVQPINLDHAFTLMNFYLSDAGSDEKAIINRLGELIEECEANVREIDALAVQLEGK